MILIHGARSMYIAAKLNPIKTDLLHYKARLIAAHSEPNIAVVAVHKRLHVLSWHDGNLKSQQLQSATL